DDQPIQIAGPVFWRSSVERAAVTSLLGNGTRRGNPTTPKKRFKASGSVAIWFPRLIPSPSTPNSGPILKRTQVSLSVVGSKGSLVSGGIRPVAAKLI